MSPTYVKRLGFKTQKTNVRAQKIDGSILETFKMVIADFQVENKISRPRFFKERFLVADTKFEVILEISFLKLSNANMFFGEKTFTWRSYTTNKALSTTKHVQLIDKKDFIIVTLNINNKTFVVQIVIRKWEEMALNPTRNAQIEA